MQKRAVDRISSHVKIRFYCCNQVYTGNVMNLSEKGMFICTKNMCFPFAAEFDVFIPFEEEILHVPVKLSWIKSSLNSDDDIGVELLNPTQNYVEFVNSLRASM
jgi:hypothetical protein